MFKKKNTDDNDILNNLFNNNLSMLNQANDIINKDEEYIVKNIKMNKEVNKKINDGYIKANKIQNKMNKKYKKEMEKMERKINKKFKIWKYINKIRLLNSGGF